MNKQNKTKNKKKQKQIDKIKLIKIWELIKI